MLFRLFRLLYNLIFLMALPPAIVIVAFKAIRDRRFRYRLGIDWGSALAESGEK